MARVYLSFRTGTNPDFDTIGTSSQYVTRLNIKGLSQDEKNVISQTQWKFYEQTQTNTLFTIKTTDQGANISATQIINASRFVLDLDLPLRKYYEVQFRFKTIQGWSKWSKKFKFKTRNSDYRLPSFIYAVNENNNNITTISKENAYKKQNEWQNYSFSTKNVTTSSIPIIGRCQNTITLNVYDPTETTEWKTGVDATSYTGLYRGVGTDSAGGYSIYLSELPINGIGQYQVISLNGACGLTNGNADEMTISIWKKSNTTFTKLAEYDATESMPLTSGNATFSINSFSNFSFSVDDSSKNYFIAMGFHRTPAAGTNIPGARSTNSIGTNYHMYGAYISNAESLPSSFDSSTIDSFVSWADFMIMNVTLRTSVRKVFDKSISASNKYLVPRRLNNPYMVKFDTVQGANLTTFSIKLNENNAGAESNKANVILDFSSPNYMKFGPASSEVSIAMNDTYTDSFDIAINPRPSVSRMDMFYLNRKTGQGPEGTSDFATFSHWAKANASEPSEDTDAYNIGDFSYVSFSGTGSVSSIQVGWEPVVIIGDSQTANTSSGLLNLVRTGSQWPTQFSYDRVYWIAGISGNRISKTASGVHTRGDYRYKHITPGQGDLAYMKGVIYILSSYGVNDASYYGDDVATAISNMSHSLDYIVDDAISRGNDVILLALPPWGAGSTNQNKTIRQWNNTLHAKAVEQSISFYSMYSDALHNQNTYTWGDEAAGSWFDVNALHWNDTGAALVVSNAVSDYENNTMKLYPDCY